MLKLAFPSFRGCLQPRACCAYNVAPGKMRIHPAEITNVETEALKSMLIIPRTPSPPPLEERDISTLSPAELVELQKQLKSMKVCLVLSSEL